MVRGAIWHDENQRERALEVYKSEDQRLGRTLDDGPAIAIVLVGFT